MNAPVAEVERAASLAWPARETVSYDGWLLRYGDGFSRRINSVAAAGASTIPLDEKLGHCRRWYRKRTLPLLFRITPATAGGLDIDLDERGFRAEGHTIVMTRSSFPSGVPPAEVRIGESLSDTWIAAELDLAGVDRDQAGAWLSVLERIPEPAGFALLTSADGPVAAGIGVVVDDWLGVFEVVVDPAQRRRGHARALMGALHSWASLRGAERAFLQVVVENRAAIALYDGLGYQEAYRYRYRRSPD
jgi:ribosomal protein S18 acetylase RimI-like enzyme